MKDLVDHIRTVHFTVFIVALVLTVALQGRKKPQLDRAASDARAIRLLEQKWSKVEDAFRKPPGLHVAAKGTPTKGARLAGLQPGRYLLRGNSVNPHRRVIFNVPRTWIYVDGTKTGECKADFEFFETYLRPLDTLKKFLRFWDDNRDGQCAFVEFDLATNDAAAFCGGIERVAATASDAPVTASLLPHATFNGNWQISATLETAGPEHKHICDFATISFPYTPADLPTIFAGVADQARNWGDGKSRDEFKDLIAEAKYLDESPLPQLEGALDERANSDTERVELFQAKLPVEAIATYGTLVLVTCQLYLLAHLLELRRMARDVARFDWPTGYIGLYENRLIFLFTFVSIVVWPPFPLILVTRAASNWSSAWLAWSALVISVAIAVWSAVTLMVARRTNAPTTKLG
jgi:hypothetical protein